jgi:uncharacterized protein YciI
MRSRRFVWMAILLAVADVSVDALQTQSPPATAAPTRQSAFVALYERGPGWDDGKGAFQQTSINEHMQFLRANSEKLIAAAPFRQGVEAGAADRTVGMVIVLASSQEEAERLLANDPAVVQKLMVVKVRQWMVERVRSY